MQMAIPVLQAFIYCLMLIPHCTIWSVYLFDHLQLNFQSFQYLSSEPIEMYIYKKLFRCLSKIYSMHFKMNARILYVQPLIIICHKCIVISYITTVFSKYWIPNA